MDLLGRGHVGGGEDVVTELCDAKLTPVDGDGIDGAFGVGLLGRGDGVEILREADAVEAADEDFGVGDRAIGAVGVGHAVEGEGDGVEVALGDDAGGVDEVLEVGAALDGGLVEVGDGTDGLEIEEDDGVGFGEKARGFRGSVGAEIERHCKDAEKEDGDEQRDQRAFAHVPLWGEGGRPREGVPVGCMGADEAVSMGAMLPVLRCRAHGEGLIKGTMFVGRWFLAPSF